MQKKAQTKYSITKSSKNIFTPEKVISTSIGHSETLKFNKFDIVWAKITGYPWWPAIVTTVPGEKDGVGQKEDTKRKYALTQVVHNTKVEYRVDFIADETHAFLKKNFLLKYIDNRDRLYAEGLQFSSRKRRYFQMAINEADQLQQVLQISMVEADQCAISEKKKDSCLKQGENIQVEKKEKKDHSHVQIRQQMQGEEQQQGGKETEKCPTIAKRSGRCVVTRQREYRLLSVQNTVANQLNGFSFMKDAGKKQVNNVKVAPSVDKRNGRHPRGVKPSPESIFVDEKKNICNSVNNAKIQEEKKQIIQQNLLKNQHEIYEEKQNTEVKLIKTTNNEVEDKGIYTDRKQLRSGNIKSPMQLQRSEIQMGNLLKKYKLDTVDEVQAQFKTYNKTQATSLLQNTSSKPLKGNSSMIFIKNVFSQLSKKKNQKRTNGDKCYYHSESSLFAQNLTIIIKLKEFQHEKMPMQRKLCLVQYAKKYTARKMYTIVQEILRKHCFQQPDQLVLSKIKERCKDISDLIFGEQQIQKTHIQKKANQLSHKKKTNNHQSVDFFTCFKRKLDQSIKFIRLFSLQNWQLLTKVTTFSTQLCIQIKSFEQFLQKQCHMIMRNEQKFDDIVKQIGIQNQKTAFACGPLVSYMEVEDGFGNLSPRVKNG